jgi:hypothetical protein
MILSLLEIFIPDLCLILIINSRFMLDFNHKCVDQDLKRL